VDVSHKKTTQNLAFPWVYVPSFLLVLEANSDVTVASPSTLVVNVNFVPLDITNYPACSSLCPSCVNGNCSAVTSTCVCNGNWAGPACSECAPGYSGSDCESKYEWVKIVGVIAAVLVVLGGGAFALWWFKFRKTTSAFVDETLELELHGGRRLAGGDPLVGLTDEEENIADDLVADAHDSDEEKGDKKTQEKASLISLDDYETAHKKPENVNLLG